MLSPSERSQRARIAAFTVHSSGKTNTAKARAEFAARFRREVLSAAAERGEELTEPEIERRTAAARKLYFARLAFASAKARRSRVEAQ